MEGVDLGCTAYNAEARRQPSQLHLPSQPCHTAVFTRCQLHARLWGHPAMPLRSPWLSGSLFPAGRSPRPLRALPPPASEAAAAGSRGGPWRAGRRSQVQLGDWKAETQEAEKRSNSCGGPEGEGAEPGLGRRRRSRCVGAGAGRPGPGGCHLSPSPWPWALGLFSRKQGPKHSGWGLRPHLRVSGGTREDVPAHTHAPASSSGAPHAPAPSGGVGRTGSLPVSGGNPSGGVGLQEKDAVLWAGCLQQVRDRALAGAGTGPPEARWSGWSPRTEGDEGSSQIAEEGAPASEPPSQSPRLISAPHQGWGLCCYSSLWASVSSPVKRGAPAAGKAAGQSMPESVDWQSRPRQPGRREA